MDVDFIESEFEKIYAQLEEEVMQILQDQSLDKKQTNLRMKPIVSTKQILSNALQSIEMVQKLSQENN